MKMLQAPSTKLQRSFKAQTPNFENGRVMVTLAGHLLGRGWYFGLGVSMVFGGWCLVLFSGCAVGPNYKRPSIQSPAAFRGDTSPTNSSFADLEWWRVYQDTNLQALVREAFTNNYDIRIALTRVEQARALAMQARSQFVPSIDYRGSVGRGRNVVLGSPFFNKGNTVNSAAATLN